MGAVGWLCASPAEAQAVELTPKERLKALRDRARDAVFEGRLEEALAPFRSAWELGQSHQDICAVAKLQTDLSQWRDAAENLSICLSVLPETEKPGLGKTIQGYLRKARARVGALSITSNVPGAEVFINGKVAGKLPLERPLFVDPGWHGIELRAPGYEVDGRVWEFVPGDWRSWDAKLIRSQLEIVRAEPLPIPPTPSATLEPPVSAPNAEARRASSLSPSGRSWSQMPLKEESGKEPRPLMIAGISLGFAGLGVATPSFVAALVAQSQANALMKNFAGEGYTQSCSESTAQLCNDIAELRGRSDAFMVVGLGGLVLGATGLALVTYDIFRPSPLKKRTGVQGAMVVVPGGGALRVTGSF
jgi:hypothetical protein